MSVNAPAANKCWQDNFVRQADKVIHGVKRLGDCLDGDAPIASDREHHAITSFQQSAAGRQAVAPFVNPVKKEKKRKRGDPPRQGGNAPTGGQAQPVGVAQGGGGVDNTRQVNGFEVCIRFQSGKCWQVDANGAAGPCSCAATLLVSTLVIFANPRRMAQPPARNRMPTNTRRLVTKVVKAKVTRAKVVKAKATM